MKQIAFSFDVSRCSACMACVVACQDQNDCVDEPAYRQVTSFESGDVASAKISSLSIACAHCGDSPCLMVCPTGAIFKQGESGIIDINRDLCVGCHSCQLACPFGAPKFLKDGKMAKCDLCYARVASGLQPACVRVCPTGALTSDSLEELSRQKTEKASLVILKSLSPQETIT
jgi:anaerobic dimethyl sulfoxide reductase subunit B